MIRYKITIRDYDDFSEVVNTVSNWHKQLRPHFDDLGITATSAYVNQIGRF